MAIGKTLRFEVFARDQFTCQYCGQRPPDVVLEYDRFPRLQAEQSVMRLRLSSVPPFDTGWIRNRFGIDEDRAFDKLVPYIGAILRNRSEDKDSGAVQ